MKKTKIRKQIVLFFSLVLLCASITTNSVSATSDDEALSEESTGIDINADYDDKIDYEEDDTNTDYDVDIDYEENDTNAEEQDNALESENEETIDYQLPTAFGSVIESGTVGIGGAPWRLYSNGTLEIDEGTFSRGFSVESPWIAYQANITQIIFNGPVNGGSNLGWIFSNLSNLTTITNADFLDTSNATTMNSAFRGASSLVSVDVSAWNTSNVVFMQYMFEGASSLTSIDVSEWDVSSVLRMESMFWNARNLTTIDVSNWNTANVNNMRRMFQNTYNLTSIDVSGWDTSFVTDMYHMFRGASSLTSIDVSGWDTGRVVNMAHMFQNTTNLAHLDVSAWNTSSVTRMDAMFWNATSLTFLDVSQWQTGNVLNMRRMFQNANSLTNLDVSAWNTGRVTDMYHMFMNANSLTYLDVSAWNTGNVRNMGSTFQGASGLTTLDVSAWNTAQVTNMAGMFWNATGLTYLDVSAWNTGNVLTMNRMFQNANSLTDLNVSGWDTSRVTNMYHLFMSASSLTSLDLSAWNTGNVTNMGWMFGNATGLVNLDVSNFNTSNVTQMHNMFQNIRVVELDLSSFDTSRVINMTNMFASLNTLRVLTLGAGWQTNLTNQNLPLIPSSSRYTGRWENVGTGTIDNPQGNREYTSPNLLNTLDGNSRADTWIWQRLRHTVTFEALNGTVTPADVEIRVLHGYTIADVLPQATIPTAMPNNSNYEFLHWTSNDASHPNEIATADLDGLIITQDTVFTAVFVRINRTVTFEAPDGTLNPNDISITVPSGDRIVDVTPTATIPEATPNNSNYEFSHWISSDVSHPSEIATADLDELVITQDTIFTAIFRPIFVPITGISNDIALYLQIMLAVAIISIGGIYYKFRKFR